jgi:predicted RNA-binding protein
MVILRATSILGGHKEDKGMMCSITLDKNKFYFSFYFSLEVISLEDILMFGKDKDGKFMSNLITETLFHYRPIPLLLASIDIKNTNYL